jgi:hypothetical protein
VGSTLTTVTLTIAPSLLSTPLSLHTPHISLVVMQLGFLLIETGMVSVKGITNILFKVRI